jgi:serine/threonine protein kinase
VSSLNWSDIGEAFDHLAHLPPEARAGRLASLRDGDPHFFRELNSLLAAHDSAEGFFEERIPRLFGSLAPNVSLVPGEKLLHFEIAEFLGEGSSARVYLARDTELERLVALKVTLSESREARTLAAFNIDGIIQVHSEHVVEHNGVLLRLMCLQFVPGPTLSALAQVLSAEKKSGKTFLEMLETCSRKEAAFDPASLKWREQLARLDLTEAVVLIGVRLAEILAHAHSRGILHLDIKPANILIDPYGRPFLSDFNVSAYTERLAKGDLGGMGGTPHFMPPEQARFFETKSAEDAAKLDERSDVFALGVVLKDLLEDAPPALREILGRATEAEQNSRTASARRFERELCGWLRVRLAENEMPRLWRGFGWILDRPLFALIALTVASQMVASVINISYNQLQVVAALTPMQNEVFMRWVAIYNGFTYPLATFCAYYALRALFLTSAGAERARRTALRVPTVMFLAISIGWLPGAWVFPRVIDHFAGPVDPSIYWHFLGSFSLGWLISTTTSLALALFVMARALYPKFWQGESDVAERELAFCERLNKFLIFAAALVPLSGVLMIALIAPQEADFRSFKILILATVGFGMLNLLLVQRLSQEVECCLKALKHPRSFD